MCSSVVHVIFNVTLFTSVVLLIAALATPAWRHVAVQTKEQDASTDGTTMTTLVSRGLFVSKCVKDIEALNGCFSKFWESLQQFEQSTLVLVTGSLAFALIASVYSSMAMCVCCCKSCLLPPLLVLTCMAFSLDFAGVVTYGVSANVNVTELYEQSKVVVGETSSASDALGHIKDLASRIGYSLVLAASAGVLLLISMILATIMMTVNSVSPIG